MNQTNEKKRCDKCVMDNSSDKTIKFDSNGNCNYCTYAFKRKDKVYFPNELGKQLLEKTIHSLKKEGKGKNYDCLMGISGGLDSSYLACLGYKHDLRILAIHVDDGFNSPIAEKNIQNLCEKCNIDLIIEKPDTEQFTDATKAFFLAGLPGLCNVQDNIIFSYLYKNARKYKVTNFLTGANFSLESILQRGEAINAADGYHIKAVCDKYGKKGYDKLPIMSLVDSYILSRYIYRLRMYKLLDYIDYNKNKAIKELREFSDFNYYGGKHYESILTHFTQIYYLPKKFGVDKRTSHLSSLIVSDQMKREEALIELQKPLYEKNQIEEIISFIANKFEMSYSEFLDVLNTAPKSHFDYPNSWLNNFSKIARIFRKYLFD